MKFDDLLLKLEGTSPLRTFYHVTPIGSARNIVQQNTFLLSSSHSEAGMSKSNRYVKYPFYLSTARTPSSDYLITAIKYDTFPTVIEIDGSKLSDSGYKIVPFNWQMDQNDTYETLENEDRVLSKKPSIVNALKYIIAFHIYNPHKTELNEKQYNIYKTGVNAMIDSGKSVYLYNTKKDLMILNRTKRKLLSNPIE